VVSIDVKKNIFGKNHVYTHSGKKLTKYDPLSYARLLEEMGAGEIIINSIDQDGMMNGYDIKLIREISEIVGIPVVALGGAGNNMDLRKAVKEGYASAVAAGSLFVFHGPRKAVLVNYPEKEQLHLLFKDIL
jgi:imidazole glycerol-phosphate synthase subunit HisF